MIINIKSYYKVFILVLFFCCNAIAADNDLITKCIGRGLMESINYGLKHSNQAQVKASHHYYDSVHHHIYNSKEMEKAKSELIPLSILDINYKVLSSSCNYENCFFKVILNKKVTKDNLLQIALKLHDSLEENNDYINQKIHIEYFLTTLSGFAWATGDFDSSTFKVEIPGLMLEEEKNLKIRAQVCRDSSKKIGAKMIGAWFDDYSTSGGLIIIWQKNKKLLMTTIFPDYTPDYNNNSDGVYEKLNELHKAGKTIYKIEGREDYYVLDNSGNLKDYDFSGLVTIYPRVY